VFFFSNFISADDNEEKENELERKKVIGWAFHLAD